MATEDHLNLSTQIKSVHRTLRQETKKVGAKRAWNDHLESTSTLQNYAFAMRDLALKHWEQNDLKSKTKAELRSRILWSINYCTEYFLKDETITAIREREKRILIELGSEAKEQEIKVGTERKRDGDKIDLLDVGSCYNPFNKFVNFRVTAIDIAPAVADVFECDFLNVNVESTLTRSTDNNNKILGLPRNEFDVVIFSLLLEYMPASDQRITCCEKAYQLLKFEGILIIVTPDSKHVGANAKLIKNWRYALALMGFSRIKYDKLEHITCMVFRKALDPDISKRWARLHKEDYMNYKVEIPQDFSTSDDEETGDGAELKEDNNIKDLEENSIKSDADQHDIFF